MKRKNEQGALYHQRRRYKTAFSPIEILDENMIVAARRGVLQSCVDNGLGCIGVEIVAMNNQGLAGRKVSQRSGDDALKPSGVAARAAMEVA